MIQSARARIGWNNNQITPAALALQYRPARAGSGYLIDSTPRSLHVFFAKMSLFRNVEESKTAYSEQGCATKVFTSFSQKLATLAMQMLKELLSLHTAIFSSLYPLPAAASAS